ncbi:olfactory receptor 1468-like [Leptodactylus fuscus]
MSSSYSSLTQIWHLLRKLFSELDLSSSSLDENNEHCLLVEETEVLVEDLTAGDGSSTGMGCVFTKQMDRFSEQHEAGNTKNNITSIILVGFPNLQNVRFVLFTSLMITYYGAISGNFLIMVLYLLSKSLQTPMYFFITQLSLCDLLLTTDIVPTLLLTVLYGESSVSFIGCIIQFSFYVNSESLECLLLSVMSYDRYVAICNPLRYHSIISRKLRVTLISIIWWTCAMISMVDVILMCNLYFCGPRVIDHFYCDFEPLVRLSCSDTTIIHKWVLIMGFVLISIPFIIIVMSYVYIVIAILKISSSTGRHKAFSTCSSHLTVVSIFFGTLFIVYYVPTRGKSLILSKVLSLFFTVLTPLLNPIIYTLRNKDIKEAFHKLKLIL